MNEEAQERATQILNGLVEQLGEGYSVSHNGINKSGIGTILMISELMDRRPKVPTPTGRFYINVFWGVKANIFNERSDGTFRSGLVDFIKARVSHLEQWCAGRILP